MDRDERNSVCAVVVTYNRPQELWACLSSLLAQKTYGLDHIHVVVNSFDEATLVSIRSLMAEDSLISISRFDNVGPAGGFHYGIKRFLEGSWKFVWLMDDDIVVDEYCLTNLLQHASDHTYIFPRVIKGDGEEVVSFGWWGVLIAREVIVHAGLPLKELFYWAEDTEYLQNRLTRVCRIVPFRSERAMVKHLHQRKEKRPSWYYYYTMRNTLYYRTYVAGYTWYRFRRTLILFPQSLYTILTKEDNKIKKIGLLFYGFYHGLIGRIGRLVDPALNK